MKGNTAVDTYHLLKFYDESFQMKVNSLSNHSQSLNAWSGAQFCIHLGFESSFGPWVHPFLKGESRCLEDQDCSHVFQETLMTGLIYDKYQSVKKYNLLIPRHSAENLLHYRIWRLECSSMVFPGRPATTERRVWVRSALNVCSHGPGLLTSRAGVGWVPKRIDRLKPSSEPRKRGCELVWAWAASRRSKVK